MCCEQVARRGGEERWRGEVVRRSPEVAGLAELVVVEPDEGGDGLLHGRQLHQRHLPVLREELKCLKQGVKERDRLEGT